MLGLKLPTDPRWVNIVETNIEEILSDHAWCEQKAATNAVTIISLNPELTDLVNVRNPFIAAKNHRLPTGEWQGQHRGWKLLKSIENVLHQCNPGMEPKRLDLGSTGGHRIKVCYNQHEELGIFVVRQTGSRMVNTLTTFKSMYKQ